MRLIRGCDGESVCRRDSVREPNLPTPWMAIHLCGLPGSVCGRDALSLHGLAPGGVYLATPVARGAGALLPHLFTLTRLVTPRGTRKAVCFLWHFPASRLDWRKPAPFPTESRPSSTQRTAPRPSDRLPVTASVCLNECAFVSTYSRRHQGVGARGARCRAPRRVVRTGSPCDLR